jgi:hypothetical protein
MIDLKDFKGAAVRLDGVDIPRMAARIDVPEDRVRAVDETESRGSGFDKLGRPKMLFEPHLFYKLLTGADRDKAVASGLAYSKWKKDYPADSYPRMVKAMAINRDAALKAASWGRYQTLGDHYAMLGYSSPDAMVKAFMDDEESHLEGFVTFIIASGVDDDLRAGRYDVFFRVYNGPAYVQNGYPAAFKANLAKWVKVPDAPVENADPMQTDKATITTVQRRLIDLGYKEIGMPDGDLGSRTRGAILGFRVDHGLPLIPVIDKALLAALMVAPVRPVSPARANATVADLRAEGSTTIKIADKSSGAAVALGGVSVAGAVLDQVGALKDHVGAVQGLLDSLGPLKDSAIALGPWVVGGIALYIVYQQYMIRQNRLADHRSGKTAAPDGA